MWPEHRGDAVSRQIPVERAVEALYAESFRRWVPTIRAGVLPALTAAGALPPDPSAADDQTAQQGWSDTTRDVVLAVIGLLWAATVYEAMPSLGLPIPDLPSLPKNRRTYTYLLDDVDGKALDIVAEAVTLSRAEIAEAAARIDNTPVLAQIRDDMLAAETQRADHMAAVVHDKLAVARDKAIVLAQKQQLDTADTVIAQRTAVAETLDVGGPTIRQLAESAGHDSGAVQNHAVVEAAVYGQDEDDPLDKVWIATIDSKTRPTHWAADGQRVALNAAFIVGGEALAFPQDTAGSPREIKNCVVGSTQVNWPGQHVHNATRRRYSGTFVDLITADGRVLTITAKHLVLTPVGYVHADSLCPGDYVIGAPTGVDSPEINDMPPCIEQVYGAFSGDGVSEWVPLGPMDFHGDVSEGDKVEIVGSDRNLGYQAEECRDGLVWLSDGPRMLTSSSPFRTGFDLPRTGSFGAVGVTSPSGVGGQSRGPTFGDGQACSTDTVSLGLITDRQTQTLEIADDSGAADTENQRHLLYANAVGMVPTQLINVKIYTATHDVFNLSTTQEWYIGNGIAVHNCRCRVGILGRDEKLPDEVDRHTERLAGRDATARHREGSQADEIERREREGNIRARDDKDGMGQVASAAPDEGQTMANDDETQAETYRTFSAVIALIGEPTSDSRMLSKKIDLSMRSFPQPLMWCKQTGYGHEDAYTVGVIEGAEKVKGKVTATGYLLNTPEADEAANELAHGVTSPSVDLADSEWEATDRDENPIDYETYVKSLDDGDPIKIYTTITKAELIGTTLVATAAFGDTSLTLNAERETRDVPLVAAAVAQFKARTYPAAFFADQHLTEPTPVTSVTVDGVEHVFGHFACEGSCHRGLLGQCVTPPMDDDFANFHTSPPVQLDDGETIAVGRLTVGGGHASTARGVSGADAAAHYDNVATCWALVRVYKDAHGLAFTGVRAPWVSDEQFEQGMSAPLSGDWRDYGRGLKLTAVHSVNTPGYMIASGATDAEGRPLALVASLAPTVDSHPRSVAVAAGIDVDKLAAAIVRKQREDATMEQLMNRAKDRPELPPEPDPMDELMARAKARV